MSEPEVPTALQVNPAGARGALEFFLRHVSGLGRFAGLFLVIVLFGTLDRMSAARTDSAPTFLTMQNFRTVAAQTVIVALAALGATMVIVSAGIDLSVGSVIALTTVVVARALEAEWSPTPALLLGVGTAAVCGLLNGVAVVSLRIVPFIVTLGMMSVARGVAKLVAGEQSVYPAEMTWLEDIMMPPVPPDNFSALRPDHWLQVFPPGVWVLVVAASVVSIVLRKTVFGRHVFAIGSNEATARLCGVAVGRDKIAIYTLAGVFAGLAGVMQFSRLTLGDPTVAAGLELDIIAAVVIGGGSLFGGEGTTTGTIVGAFTLQFLRNGCNLLGVNNYYQEILIGLIIVGAVAMDQLRSRLNRA